MQSLRVVTNLIEKPVNEDFPNKLFLRKGDYKSCEKDNQKNPIHIESNPKYSLWIKEEER
jgi:hypothetical protein